MPDCILKRSTSPDEYPVNNLIVKKELHSLKIANLTDYNKIATMRQTNTSGLRIKVGTIFILKFFRYQFQIAHFRFVKRPRCGHDQSRVDGRNVVPLFFPCRFARKMRDGWHQKWIHLQTIYRKMSRKKSRQPK